MKIEIKIIDEAGNVQLYDVSSSLPNETTKGHWEWDSKFNTYKYIIQ